MRIPVAGGQNPQYPVDDGGLGGIDGKRHTSVERPEPDSQGDEENRAEYDRARCPLPGL